MVEFGHKHFFTKYFHGTSGTYFGHRHAAQIGFMYVYDPSSLVFDPSSAVKNEKEAFTPTTPLIYKSKETTTCYLRLRWKYFEISHSRCNSKLQNGQPLESLSSGGKNVLLFAWSGLVLLGI